MIALIIVSVVVFALGWIMGFETNNQLAVDLLFYWAYAMVALALIGIVIIGGWVGIKNDKKFLIKALSVIGGVAVICLLVYLLSPGAPAVGIADQPSQGTLRLTDTVLNLTYLTGAVAILAIVVGEFVKGIRNKRDAK